ncbi:MAG TPA: HlyD family efflux transporter periplasmic adaptor subunit [Thermoanaerobaculia bacterium]
MDMHRLLPFALLPLLVSGCHRAGAESPGTSADLVVRKGDFASELVLSGELDAARGEMLSVPSLPSMENSIKWIADDGASVRAGETVVELDNTALTADLDARRQTAMQAAQESQQRSAEWLADLEQLELEVEKKQGDLDKAQLKASVPTDLLSLREFEERQGALRAATVGLEKAEELLRARRIAIDAERRNLQLRFDKAQREIDRAERAIVTLLLKAPRDGIVVVRDHFEGRKLQSGDTVWVGFPLALLPDFDSIRLKATLADVDDGRIARGMPVTVTLDGYPDAPLRGRIAAVSAVAQESRRMSLRRHFEVWIDFDQLDHTRMRPGLSARAVVHREKKTAVLLAPRAAIDFSGDTPRAKLQNGRMEKVVLGGCNAQECVVTDGLSEGTRLRPIVEVAGG